MGKRTKRDHSVFRITPYHVNNEVTGSSVLVEVDGLKILLDLGIYQSSTQSLKNIYEINYRKNKIPFSELDYIIVTHCHADHCAGLPMASIPEFGFKGKIMVTEASLPLVSLNIRDCAHIMAEECKAYNKKYPKKPILPLYTMEHADETVRMLQGYGYDEKIPLSNNVYFEFMPCGHIFGDASIYITFVQDQYTQKHLLYTGDHNYGTSQPRPFTKQWDTKRILKPSVVITESTYAGQKHREVDVATELERIIMNECVNNKRVLFIPTFAIGRSTQLVYYLRQIFEKNEAIGKANLPIYMCGKMMASSHNTFGNPYYKKYVDEQWHEHYDIFNWGKVQKIDSFIKLEEKCLDNKPKIILASSGMCTGGYSTYLCQQLIGRQNVSFLASGYQGVGTVGRAIIETKNSDKKVVSIQGLKYIVRANILGILPMSGHADNNQLMGLIKDGCDNKVLKKVVIIHGDNDRKNGLKEDLEQVLKMDNKEIVVPKPTDVIKV